jgi:hypothetical protein
MGPSDESHGHEYNSPSAAQAEGHVSPAEPQERGDPKTTSDKKVEDGKGGVGPGPFGGKPVM